VTELGGARWKKITDAGERSTFTRGAVEIRLGARSKIRQEVVRAEIRAGQCDMALLPWAHREFKIFGVDGWTCSRGGSVCFSFQLWFGAHGAVLSYRLKLRSEAILFQDK